MRKKLPNTIFGIVLLAIIAYPALYFYQHPELLVVPTEFASSATPAPTATQTASSGTTPAPAPTATLVSREAGECLIVQALPGAAPGSLNLRSGPGTEYASITVLSDGQLLTSSGLELDWYSVTVQGDPALAGYVNAAYVEACP